MRSILTSKVLSNYFALSVLQAGNYLLPLVLIPYLLRVLGLQTFGEWAFAVSFVSIFRTVANYGFDLTATRAVALRRTDGPYLNELYGAVLVVRISLIVLCSAALLLLATGLRSLQDVLLLAQLSMLVLIGEALFPVWLFQGMETMSVITNVRLTFKALNVVLVMLLVKSADDVLIVPIIEGAVSMMAALVALLVATRRFKISLCLPHLRFVKEQIREGATVFASFITVHFYSTINVVVLGVVFGPIAVSQFTIAEKIYSAIRGMLGPIVQAIYPKLSRLHSEDVGAFMLSARQVAIVLFAALAVMAGVLYCISDWIVTLIAGQYDAVAAHVTKILALSMCFAAGTFLSPMLIVQGRAMSMMQITVGAALLNLTILLPLMYWLGVSGAAWAFLLTQACQTGALLIANVAMFERERAWLRLVGRKRMFGSRCDR